MDTRDRIPDATVGPKLPESVGAHKRLKTFVALALLAIVLIGLGTWGLSWSETATRKETDEQTGQANEQAARHEAYEAVLAWVISDEDRDEARRVLDELTQRLDAGRASGEMSLVDQGVAERALRDAEASYVRASLATMRAERQAHRAQILYDLEASKRPGTEGRGGGRGRDGELFVTSLFSALERARDAKLSLVQTETRARELELWLDEYVPARRNARRAANAAGDRYELVKSRLATLVDGETPEGPDVPSKLPRALVPARRLVLGSLRAASPAFLILGLLMPLAALAGMIPWVRTRLQSVWTKLTEDAPARTGETKLGTLIRQPTHSFGGFAMRMGAAGAVAVLTVGAFALTIPGDSIDLDLDRPRVSKVGVDVGEFGVTIPGRKLTLETPEPNPPAPVVTMDGYTIHVPGKDVEIDPANVTIVSKQSRVVLPEITLRPPDVRIVVDDPKSEDLAAILRELSTKVGDLTAKVSDLDGEMNETKATITTVRSAAVHLIGKTQDTIDEENRKISSRVLHQDRMAQNCSRFCGMATVFPETAKEFCVYPTRFEPLMPWKARRIWPCSGPQSIVASEETECRDDTGKPCEDSEGREATITRGADAASAGPGSGRSPNR